MTKNTPLFALSSLLLAHPTITSAQDLWTPELRQSLIASSTCTPCTIGGSDLGENDPPPICCLWTLFHLDVPSSTVAFVRQGEDSNIPYGTQIVIVENDTVVELDDNDWELAMNLRQFVPLFVHENAQTHDLSIAELEALVVDGNTANHLNCCLHTGDVNLKSHESYFGKRFGVDPKRFKERMVDKNVQLDSYDKLVAYLKEFGDDGSLVVLGLRGVNPDARIRPLTIDGLKLGNPNYPLKVNTKVYMNADEAGAQATLKAMIEREIHWIANDWQYFDRSFPR